MASYSNSSNKMSVPEAKGAMDKFKMEVASELGVPLKRGLQRRFDFTSGRLNRWRDGQKDDQAAGRTDVI